MKFIRKSNIPQDHLKNFAFRKIVVVERPQKQEKERTHLTVVGTHIDYPWNRATPTSDLTTAKLPFNSVISTPHATFHSADIKNFYLNTRMDQPEYMKLKFNLIPTEIVQKQDLHKLESHRWINVCINLGMYGLPQAGILANKVLTKQLSKAGCYQYQFTPGLWQHVWRPLTFCLEFDDFGIITVGITHAKHLQAELKKHNDVSMDWKGNTFCRIHLQWDYKNCTVDLSLLSYIQKTLL
ncbi:hypothetical protein ACHAW6_004815 [Cyclotella cf. meneghiniana]